MSLLAELFVVARWTNYKDASLTGFEHPQAVMKILIPVFLAVAVHLKCSQQNQPDKNCLFHTLLLLVKPECQKMYQFTSIN
jgi:hypothetical protein